MEDNASSKKPTQKRYKRVYKCSRIKWKSLTGKLLEPWLRTGLQPEDEVASIAAHAGCGSLKTNGRIITFHHGMITGTDKLLPQILSAEASKHLGMNAPRDNHLESVR
jgi:hypothetical protein